jgi:hypothetical protein
MSLAVGTRIGSFEVTAAIGAGGMGEVYRARDAKLGRDVALKGCRRRSLPTRTGWPASSVKRSSWPP